MKRILILFSIGVLASTLLAGCNLPRVELTPPAPNPTISSPTDTAPPLIPATELGLAENPLILALAPSATPAQINAAKILATQFTERTGYVIVTVIPDSQAALVEAFEKGNTHIALLDPYAYALAHQKELVKAQFAVVKNNKTKYGAQFIAPRKAGFTTYFNALNETNTVNDPRTALIQFTNKKPCWADETSPSGYVIPLGYLNEVGASPKPAGFMGGQPSVVRAMYAGGICDFGGTYIDARKFPSLEDQFPDLMEQVVVIWRTPEIIPYDVFVFSSQMPEPMRTLFANTLPAILQTTDGKSAFQLVYDVDHIEPVNDGFYIDFRHYVELSEIDITTLLLP